MQATLPRQQSSSLKTQNAFKIICPTPIALRSRVCVRTQQDPVDGMLARVDNPIRFDVHGRHVDVDFDLREAVIDRLSPVLDKMCSSMFVEGAGGVSHVDVRLMNSNAEIKVYPVHTDKALHDTFLRRGELMASADGDDTWDSFERAVEQLECKLKPQRKPAPRKVNYRSFQNASRSNSTGGGSRQ